MGAHVNNGTGHGPRAATESADSAESGPTPTVADFSTDFDPDDPDLGWGDPSAQDGGLNS
jgi:hypothetical protein